MRILALALGLLCVRASAQITSNPLGDSGVAYNIQFQVLDQGSQPVKNVLFDLLNFSGVKVMGAMTNSEGRVIFRISPGTYVLALKGNDIEDARFDFRVEQADGDRIEQLTVRRKNGVSALPGGLTTAATLAVPSRAKVEFQKGSAALAGKDYEKARAFFDKAIALYPHYAEAQNGLGIVSLRTGRPDEARAHFKLAIDADNQHPTAYLNLARMYLIEQNAPAALPLLKKSVALNPSDAEALSQLSFAQFASGDCPSAIATAASAHAIPHHGAEFAHFVAGLCYASQKDPARAESEFNVYLKEAPSGPYAPKVRAALQELHASR